MNAKSLKLLRIGALVLGWLLIAGILEDIWSQLFLYSRVQKDATGFFGSTAAQFNLANSLGSFFSGLGNAFLAFLIAAVLRMIEKHAPVGNGHGKRLMIVCCVSYLAAALTGFCSSISKTSGVLRLQDFAKYFWWFWLPYSSTLITVFVPVLYAATIFVLYTHFTKMVTFESEVA
jgi:hypothetical protein